MTHLNLFVPGTPKPKGSWRPIVSKTTGKPFLVPNDSKSKDWEQAVRYAVAQAWEGEPTREPVEVTLGFIMPRPKKHYRTGKHANELSDDAPWYHDKKPDLDKLIRCVADSMTGVVYVDDAQIVMVDAWKNYQDHTTPGVSIAVKAL